MKILFLHLSDLHIKSENAVSQIHINKMLASLRQCGKFDKMLIIFSGDIAFSGAHNEYEVGNTIVGTIIKRIRNKRIYNDKIEIIFVPGNHDVEHATPVRSHSELQQIYDDFSYDEYLDDELKKQDNFFNFAYRSNCFREKGVFDRKIINYNGFSVEVNMINSAVFSLQKEEDKALHYINQTAINELNKPSGANFVISVMHHAPDWFIDSQKSQIETALLCKSSLIFYGHEHIVGTKNCSYNNQAAAFIHAGGSLCNDSDWTKSEFEIGVLDTDTYEYSALPFRWNASEQQYENIEKITKIIPSKPSIEKTLVVTDEYKNNLFNNVHKPFSSSIYDYYVFPRVEAETYNGTVGKEFLEIEQFIGEIQKHKRVMVTGANGCGKTLLLKKIFLELTEKGKCVLFCDIDTIKRRESSKIVKTNFEDIYGTSYSDYVRFLQMPVEDKVLIIDDVDQIKQQDFENYISAQSDCFGLMIFATKDVIDLDMLKRMDIALKTNDSTVRYNITPFYADKRKELISKLVLLKKKKDDSIEVENTIDNLCDSIKLQKRYMSLEPEFIINFVEYYCNNIGSALSSDSSVFSKVFESNITTALSAYATRQLNIDKLYKLLSRLAYYVHFNKAYPVTEQEIIKVVMDYNTYSDDVVSPIDFLNIVKNAHILTMESDGYKFVNRNQLAYFCARAVNFKYNDTGDEEDLKYLLKYCCFGINADILMFISYITDNTRILQLFLNMTREMTSGWEEFDFKEKCPGFLHFEVEQEISPPSGNDKKEKEKADVESEKSSNEKLQTIDIYDYKEDDVKQIINQLIRSISLLSIISKCLPGFEHNMSAEMRRDFVSEIYTLPNKIYYAWAMEVDKVYDELLECLKERGYDEYHGSVKKGEENVETHFRLVASLLLLDVYSIAVSLATKDNTFRILNNFEWGKYDTYKVQHLMMLEKQKKASDFVTESISLYQDCDKNLPKFLIKNIVKHAFTSMNSLDIKMIGKLNDAFFKPRGDRKQQALMEQKMLLMKRTKNAQKGE